MLINSSTIISVIIILAGVVFATGGLILIQYYTYRKQKQQLTARANNGAQSASKSIPAEPAKSREPTPELRILSYQDHLKLGNQHYQEYRYSEALTHFLEALKHNDRDAALKYRIGRIYENLEDYSHAEQAYREVLEITPDSQETMFELARMYYKRENYDFALGTLKELLTRNPDHLDAKKLKARVMVDSGDLAPAEELLHELLKNEPENSELLATLGKCYQKQQRYDAALQIFRKLLAQDPRDKRNLKFNIYQIFLKQELFKEAIDTLQEILDNNTGTIAQHVIREELVKCWCLFAEDQARNGRVAEAFSYYNQALVIDAEQPDVYRGIGKLHASQNAREKAIDFYLKALQYGRRNTDILIDIAEMYEQLDKFDDAVYWMHKVEELKPTAQVYHYLGTLYGLKGDLVTCVNYLNKAVSKDSRFVDAYYNLGVALERQKKHKEALNMYKRVLDLDKNHVEAKANFRSLQTRVYKK